MLYVLFSVLVILIFLYFMPIVVRMDIRKDNENDKITVGLRTFYGLVKLNTEIPFLEVVFRNGRPGLKYKIEVGNKKRNKLLARITKLLSMEEGEGVYKAYKRYKSKIIPIIKYITKKTKVDNFNLKLSLGTGDAAATGILYGVTWIVIGSIMTLTRCYLKVYEPRIVVIPIFSQVQLSIEFSCIISLKLGHIINAGIKAIPALISGIRK
ncbi:MAG: DUF2953 domain-containing protein [Clostridia bacterium]